MAAAMAADSGSGRQRRRQAAADGGGEQRQRVEVVSGGGRRQRTAAVAGETHPLLSQVVPALPPAGDSDRGSSPCTGNSSSSGGVDHAPGPAPPPWSSLMPLGKRRMSGRPGRPRWRAVGAPPVESPAPARAPPQKVVHRRLSLQQRTDRWCLLLLHPPSRISHHCTDPILRRTRPARPELQWNQQVEELDQRAPQPSPAYGRGATARRRGTAWLS